MSANVDLTDDDPFAEAESVLAQLMERGYLEAIPLVDGDTGYRITAAGRQYLEDTKAGLDL